MQRRTSMHKWPYLRAIDSHLSIGMYGHKSLETRIILYTRFGHKDQNDLQYRLSSNICRSCSKDISIYCDS